MGIAVGLIILAVGVMLIYKGWRGLSWAQVWSSFQSGQTPPPGSGVHK